MKNQVYPWWEHANGILDIVHDGIRMDKTGERTLMLGTESYIF